MRKFFASMLLAASLAGCATTGSVSIDPAEIIQEARNIAKATCGFLPLAETVAQILAAGNPLLVTGSSIAHAICAAVTTPGAARGVVYVAGVPVRGQFIRR